MAVDSWGMDCLNWKPETITTAVRDQFGTELHALNYDKLQAAVSLVTSNLYHRSPGAFCAINKAFSFKPVNNKEFNVCGLDDVLWGTTEARLLEGPEQFDEEGFTTDISRYVGQLLQAEGVTTPPSNLKFAIYDDSVADAKEMSEFQDPVAWKMTMQREEEEIEDMNQFMGVNLLRLFKQLKVLPLSNSTELQQNVDNMLGSIKSKLGQYVDSEDYEP
jgi:hypothetical protein